VRLLALTLGLILAQGMAAPSIFAQTAMEQSGARQASPSQDSSSQTSSGSSFLTPQTAQDENLAAAQQEDENAVYKKSPMVRAVGRLFHLSPETASVVFEDFNFLLLAGIVIFYLAKLLPGFFRERQQKIDRQLQEARTATADASERLKVVEDRLGRLDQEIAELRERAEREAAADEQRIKQSIEDERRKIVAAAEQEIGAMAASAARQLKSFGAEIAIARASGQLRLSEDDDRLLVRDFAAGLVTSPDERRN